MLPSVGLFSKTLIATTLVAIITSLSACSESYGYDGTDIRATETVYPYRENTPYASVLKRCVLVSTVAESCGVNEMPFIGDGINTPTVDQVMDRVLVTHDWMGARFENALRNAPDDVLLKLFSSATSILIGSEVRPSFYISLTAGIQLDAAYLWTTLDEKSSVSKESDYRSDFGKDLQFRFLARTVNTDGSSLTPWYSLDDDEERPVRDMELRLYRLLYHELVHAADFMPLDKIASVNPNVSIFDAVGDIRSDWLSESLIATNPRTSREMIELGSVRYEDTAPTEEQKNLTATDVGGLMESDGAIQFYSYYSEHEDLAQLVEAALMAYHFDAKTNVGFVQKPDEDAPCSDYIVSWGQRNRLADSLVNVRSRVATNLVLGETSEITDYFDNKLGYAEPMQIGLDWCNNHTPNSAIASGSLLRSIGQPDTPVSGPEFDAMLNFNNSVHPPLQLR